MAIQVTTPLYRNSRSYAAAYGQIEQYLDSHAANTMCKKAIEDAISIHFDGHQMGYKAVTDVLDRYGADRMQYVLATTIHHKRWDGRFSDSNKEWAEGHVGLLDNGENGRPFDDRLDYLVKTHPAVLDGYVTMTRQKIRQREAHSIQDALNKPQNMQTPNTPNAHVKKAERPER